jgi:1,4-dihydroxy-2-naphthoate octaprenyltransferase
LQNNNNNNPPIAAYSLIGVIRPNFLVLTPVCILLGLTSVALSGYEIDWGRFCVVLLGALMAHISVNALNEYADFQSGLDFKTQKTPFSGGSGTLVLQPRLVQKALTIGIVSLVITIACGLLLLQWVGWELIPIGLAGIMIIIFYSGWVNRNRYLVLITPGLGFGPLMVSGTHFALTGLYSNIALVLSLVPFFLVNNLLLLNQMPDRKADQSVGRNNFAIAWTPRHTANLYLSFAMTAYLTLLLGVISTYLPITVLLGLVTLPLTVQVYFELRRYRGDNIPQLIPSLGKNVVITLLTPFLLSVGVLVQLWVF